MLRKPRKGIRKDKTTEKQCWALAGAAHSGSERGQGSSIALVLSDGDETPQAVTEGSQSTRAPRGLKNDAKKNEKTTCKARQQVKAGCWARGRAKGQHN